MSQSDKQFEDVSTLIVEAFDNFKRAEFAADPAEYQHAVNQARLQLDAAKVMATLVVSQELRAIGLLLASSTKPLGQEGVNPEATASAYTAAAVHLGLVAVPEEHGTSVHEFMEDWMNDPADLDVDK